MCDEPRSLDRKLKILRRTLVPRGKTRRPLQGIEAAIQFNRVQLARGKLQFSLLRQTVRVETAPPRLVAPTRDSNADFALSSQNRSTKSALAALDALGCVGAIPRCRIPAVFLTSGDARAGIKPKAL
jgi:hypothetical protein